MSSPGTQPVVPICRFMDLLHQNHRNVKQCEMKMLITSHYRSFKNMNTPQMVLEGLKAVDV